MNIRDIANLISKTEDLKQLEKIFDHTNVAIWFRELETGVLWVSKGNTRIYGYSQEDFENHPNLWKDVIYPEDLSIVEDTFKTVLSGKTADVEYRIIRSDWEMRWVQNYVYPIMDETGKVMSFTGMVFDITERKKVMLQLAESEERFRNLVELSPHIILVHQEGKIVFANEEAIKILGAKYIDEIIGKPIKEMMDPKDLELWKERMVKILNGEKLPYIVYQLHTFDGRVIDLECIERDIPFHDKTALMLVGRDINEIKKLQKKMMDTEQWYKSLFEYNVNSVYSFDLNGKFTSCNHQCENLSGYSKEELLEMDYLELIIPEEKENAVKYFELVKQGIPQNFRTAIFHRNGSIVNLNITVVPIIVNGKINGVFGIAQDISKEVETEQYNHHMAYHDYLTGLPNRHMLNTRLSQELMAARKKNRRLAVLFIDLDRFKIINDTLGHSMGDLLLKEVTKRLKSSVYDKDIVFRQGGDEFIVILADADRNIASKVARRILNNLAAPFHMHHHYEIYTSPSIGISLYPEDGETVETLIKHADFAMYQAKKAGKNTFKFYSSDKQDAKFNPLKMEMELRKAIERNELLLYYQPKIHLKTGRIVGVEALIRWKHPEWGLVTPENFIPIAEETGLIIPIGEWAFYTACYQNKMWQQQGFSTVVSVNISARQFTQSNLVETIQEVLKKTGLEPQYLELEITESITEDINRTISTLRRLKQLGVRISIDNFGTGFSSLYYLKQFPVDMLKIDQSFVRELQHHPNDETIVKTIISMAHNLNLSVVAEGIKTNEQLLFLQQHLCNVGQGDFFSKPVPAKELEAKIQEVEQLVGKYGISQNVNEQRWANELLRIARKDLQDTVRLQQGMTFKYKKMNHRFIHTLFDGELAYRLGIIPEQVIGKELSDIFPQKVAEETTLYYQKAWEGNKQVTFEATVNGITYFAALNPIKRGGEVVEVIGSCIDITKLKETEIALRESERKYRLIAENMTDLIAILDVNGNTIYASPSHEAVLGFSPAFYEGKSAFDHVHPEDLSFLRKQWEEMIKKKKSSQAEFRFLHRNNDWVLMEASGTPVIGKNGTVEQIVVVARDITEKRKAEELLWNSEKLSLVGELAAGIAHEIRNPITSIKGFIQLFQQGAIKQEYFDVILKEFDRIEEIIKEFLSLAKPQAIQLKPVNISLLLKDVEILLHSEANLRNVELDHKFEENIPNIMCDPNQIKQVFINLVKNSIEAIPNGGKVTIHAAKEHSNLLIKVIDNGEGISEDRLDKIGQPFYSTKEKGNGLGLMFCFRIIKQHKGTITVKSEKNKGTTVEVRLPIS
jgi:diguanylate cyclase (GGDEF)-like protein/PAS domain S-box-containing protein